MPIIKKMQSLTVFELIKQVFSSWQVIAVTIAVILYLNLVFYVARKHHRPLKIHRISIKKKNKPVAEEISSGPEEAGSGRNANEELGLEEA